MARKHPCSRSVADPLYCSLPYEHIREVTLRQMYSNKSTNSLQVTADFVIKMILWYVMQPFLFRSEYQLQKSSRHVKTTKSCVSRHSWPELDTAIGVLDYHMEGKRDNSTTRIYVVRLGVSSFELRGAGGIGDGLMHSKESLSDSPCSDCPSAVLHVLRVYGLGNEPVPSWLLEKFSSHDVAEEHDNIALS